MPFQLFGDSFPREIGISVPGEIESITDDSVTMNYKRTIKKEGSNRLSITITPKELSKKEQAELKAKICPKSTKDCSISEKDFNALPDEVKYATLRLSIKSKKPKYDIQTIFSILGLLFGSGVIIQVLGKISKTKQPPMTTS